MQTLVKSRGRKKAEPEAVPQDDPLSALANISRNQLAQLLGVNVSSTYRLQETAGFPQPFYLNKAPRWLVTEVRAYIQAQADARPSVRRAQAKAVAAEA